MTETTLPPGAIPFSEGAGYYGAQENGVMSMRWENKELISQLWKNLAYLVPSTYQGRPILLPMDHDLPDDMKSKPPINYTGARAIINIVQSVVNTVGSLSKIHQDQALILLKHIKQATRRLIVIKGVEYNCITRVEKFLVLQIVENICLLQLMRAVNGHESQQSRTNLVERREAGEYTSSSKGGGFKIPFRSNKGE